MNILKFTIQDTEIDMYFKKGTLAYTFEGKNKRYENAIKLTSKKTEDIIAASFLLFTNAMEAINENNGVSKTTKGN